ncbi:MAG TPA: DUF3052 domain-containing protein [Candidatus Polarisedimenticolia bacterium]|jgi:hypothetical protein|nr:DUF3052 domain-containing protein [Candidatus Polarisedimenticolia bacterium]
MSPSPAGYSGTPLAKKLGIKEGTRLCVESPPKDYEKLLAPIPAGATFQSRVGPTTDIVHLFATSKPRLAGSLKRSRSRLRAGAAIWVSWPKKASKVPTDITEDTIRELAFPLGLVDIKVCAVDEVWSGLKLVIRKENR